MLAASIKSSIDALANGLTPKGSTPFGTEKLSPKDALLFWLGDGTQKHPGHRYDDIGAQVLANYTPLQIAHLDAWLASYSARMPHPAQAAPTMPTPTPSQVPGQGQPAHLLPGVAGVLTRALSLERHAEGNV